MDRYHIDGHKLHYHVDRVKDWLEGQPVWPIYMEISPSGGCNHRCTYCALDFMGYEPRFLEVEMLCERLAEMGRLGVRSIMYAGEGEPLLHRQLPRIVEHTHRSGIDAALTTNGVLLGQDAAEALLPVTSWIKVSINAGTPETYARIHRCHREDFDTVVENLSRAAAIRCRGGHACTLGMQIVLLPENAGEVRQLAELGREIGMDYLVVKPYSQHPQSLTDQYRQIQYGQYAGLARELAALSDDRFSVIMRTRTMQKWDEGTRPYERCLALPFWSYVDAGGNVWGCSMFLGDEQFRYGNLYEETFSQIWQGPRRAKSLEWVQTCLDPATCRINCRMDEVNRYLWELKHPPVHANFI